MKKALSIQQPWAWLIAHSHKPVENRTWLTKFRGEFLIHAGLKFDWLGYEWVKENFPDIPMPLPAYFDRGGIVGIANLTDCVKMHPSPWFFGEFGFVIEDAKPCAFLPCKGKLGFFNPDLQEQS